MGMFVCHHVSRQHSKNLDFTLLLNKREWCKLTCNMLYRSKPGLLALNLLHTTKPQRARSQRTCSHSLTVTLDGRKVKGGVCLLAYTPVCSASSNPDPCRRGFSIRAVSRTVELQKHQEPVQIMADELTADIQQLSSTDAEAKRK